MAAWVVPGSSIRGHRKGGGGGGAGTERSSPAEVWSVQYEKDASTEPGQFINSNLYYK